MRIQQELNNYCKHIVQFDTDYIRLITNNDNMIDIKVPGKKCITIINVNTNEITNITNINTLIPALKLKKYI